MTLLYEMCQKVKLLLDFECLCNYLRLQRLYMQLLRRWRCEPLRQPCCIFCCWGVFGIQYQTDHSKVNCWLLCLRRLINNDITHWSMLVLIQKKLVLHFTRNDPIWRKFIKVDGVDRSWWENHQIWWNRSNVTKWIKFDAIDQIWRKWANLQNIHQNKRIGSNV